MTDVGHTDAAPKHNVWELVKFQVAMWSLFALVTAAGLELAELVQQLRDARKIEQYTDAAYFAVCLAMALSITLFKAKEFWHHRAALVAPSMLMTFMNLESIEGWTVFVAILLTFLFIVFCVAFKKFMLILVLYLALNLVWYVFIPTRALMHFETTCEELIAKGTEDEDLEKLGIRSFVGLGLLRHPPKCQRDGG